MSPYVTQNGENAELWFCKELHVVSGSCHMLPGFFVTKLVCSLFVIFGRLSYSQ